MTLTTENVSCVFSVGWMWYSRYCSASTQHGCCTSTCFVCVFINTVSNCTGAKWAHSTTSCSFLCQKAHSVHAGCGYSSHAGCRYSTQSRSGRVQYCLPVFLMPRAFQYKDIVQICLRPFVSVFDSIQLLCWSIVNGELQSQILEYVFTVGVNVRKSSFRKKTKHLW